MADLQQGIVCTFDLARGFGFIASDERSLYFHARQVRDHRILYRGDRVQFSIGPSAKYPGKFECMDVTLIERAPKTVQS
jgi:cold shock CspA family protein